MSERSYELVSDCEELPFFEPFPEHPHTDTAKAAANAAIISISLFFMIFTRLYIRSYTVTAVIPL